MTGPAEQQAPPRSGLRDQVVVVTGGAGAIGSAIAKQLDRLHAKVVVAGRDASKLEAVSEKLRRGATFAGCDLREARQAEALIRFAVERFGGVDAVVNCVGIGRAPNAGAITSDAVASLNEQAWDEVLDTNLRGLFHLCRAAASAMIANRRGQIIDLSSARGARRGQAFGAPYCASKRAGRAMLQALEVELRGHGVRVVSVLPDAVQTDLIAGTGLAPHGAMSPHSLAEHVAGVLTTRADVTYDCPVLLPQPVSPLTESVR